MFLGPYKLFDIINLGTIKKLQVTKISYDLDFKLNHTMKSKEYDIENNTLDICKRNNEVQFITLTKYIEKVRGYLKANPNSTSLYPHTLKQAGVGATVKWVHPF